MKLRKLSWAALGMLVLLAGCSSPEEASGGGDADRRNRPPTAAEKMARIDRAMAACPDFDKHLAEFRADHERLERVASRVAALRPALDEIDRLRATKVDVMGQRVSVWVTICRVSPSADALNPAIAKANEVVRRCEQIVRLKTVVASDCRIFKQSMAKARARPSEQTLADLRQAAAGLKTRIALVEKAWSDLDGKLALIEGPLRAGRDALNAVTAPSVRDKARQMAYRVGRMLAVTTSARQQVREHRSGVGKVTATLKAVSAGAGRG